MGYHKRSTLKFALVQPHTSFDENVWIIIVNIVIIVISLSLSACDFISAYRTTLERIINFTSHELTKSRMDSNLVNIYG